jgi:hypothetical protein
MELIGALERKFAIILELEAGFLKKKKKQTGLKS